MTNTIDKHTKRIDELEKERKQISQRLKKRRDADKVDCARLDEIRSLIHKERISSLVNVEGGVQLAFRYPHGHEFAKYNDSLVTLIKVARTRCTVQFKHDSPCKYNHRWSLLMRDIEPAGELKGWVI